MNSPTSPRRSPRWIAAGVFAVTLALVPALVGAFGFAELLVIMKTSRPTVKINPFDSVIPKLVDIVKHWKTILRSGCIGTAIGVIPGVGEDIAAWSSYAAAKRASNEPEKFGKGKVLKIEGESPDLKATIFFPSAGQKQLLLKFAKLQVLS